MLTELGHFSFIVLLCISFLQIMLAIMALYYKEIDFFYIGRKISFLQLALAGFSLFSLFYAYAVSDFSVRNVVENSYSEKPLFYKIAALWSNHEGSFLYWIFLFQGFSCAFLIKEKFSREKIKGIQFKALFLLWQNSVLISFVFFLLYASNPFSRVFTPVLQGKGLNPLLQDIALAIHPPLLYMGYAGLALCYCLAMAGFLAEKIHGIWAKMIKFWLIISWVFLTGAIAVGAYWAYYELGWGGYWSFDPVENISLLPWLSSLALIHILLALEKRNVLKLWAVFLAILSFFFILIGLFLVRSGILNSVHSFALDERRGFSLLCLLIALMTPSFLCFPFYALKTRSKHFLHFMTKESFIFVGSVFLCLSLISIIAATLYSIFYEQFYGQKIIVQPSFFIKAFIPFLCMAFLLMPIAGFLPWGGRSFRKITPSMAFSIILSFGSSFIFYQKAQSVFYSLFAMLGYYIIFFSLANLWRKTQIFCDKTELKSIFYCIKKVFCCKPKTYSASLAHIGLAIIILGITCVSAFERENVYLLKLGEGALVENIFFRLDALKSHNKANYKEQELVFKLYKVEKKLKNMSYIGKVSTGQRFFALQKAKTTEIGLYTQGFSQFYISLIEEKGNAYYIAISSKPYILCIWLGALLMVLGGACALLGRKTRKDP